jgi:Tol biopolymer transport system component
MAGRTFSCVIGGRAGQTTRASVAADGTQGDNLSFGAAISADGRFVAFVSDASNLVPQPASGRQVYVKDLVTGALERVSISSSGDPAQGFTTPPAISGDGRVVAFAAGASNLVPDDTNGQLDVFVHDRLTGTTERVSVDSAGGQADGQSIGPGIRGGTAFGPSVSADGRLVAFDSIATNLVGGDTNTCDPFFLTIPGECPDVFVHDPLTGATVRASVDSAGGQANGASTDPDISADGSTTALALACWFGELSEHATQPQDRHSHSSTQPCPCSRHRGLPVESGSTLGAAAT